MSYHKTVFFCIILFFVFTPMCSAFEIDMVSTVTSVIDGDSFYIQGDEVRFGDVSCPEWNEYGGPEATTALTSLIEGKTVYLDTDQLSGRGPYGRLIAVVYIKLNATHYLNINEYMVILGHASVSDYSNNEFSPYTWNLLELTGVTLAPEPQPETPSYEYDRDWLIAKLAELAVDYIELNSTYNALTIDYDTLQTEYNNLHSDYIELETAYTELQNEADSAIPGFPFWSIIVGFAAFLYLRTRV